MPMRMRMPMLCQCQCQCQCASAQCERANGNGNGRGNGNTVCLVSKSLDVSLTGEFLIHSRYNCCMQFTSGIVKNFVFHHKFPCFQLTPASGVEHQHLKKKAYRCLPVYIFFYPSHTYYTLKLGKDISFNTRINCT